MEGAGECKSQPSTEEDQESGPPEAAVNGAGESKSELSPEEEQDADRQDGQQRQVQELLARIYPLADFDTAKLTDFIARQESLCAEFGVRIEWNTEPQPAALAA